MADMRKFETPILVTRPYLPDLESFKTGCAEIWQNRWLSNYGPMVRKFAAALSGFLGVPESNLELLVNGTLALECGFQALGLAGGEVITTPFTFVATSHALMRIGAKPVFADVDPETLCLSPAAAEKLITSRTKAIVPVHVYGHPCDVEGFRRLGEKYGIRIVYDAAHAFGVRLNGKSIAAFGDMAMFSFHPTKLFHSCEGGLLVFRDPTLKQRLRELMNFGIVSETECLDVGTNAKMNELQALMGLECLKDVEGLLSARHRVFTVYRQAFGGCPDIRLLDAPQANHAYCPVLLRDFETRERLHARLKDCNVFSRRYFYPLLTDFAPYAYGRGTCPVAEDASRRILTLPTYLDLPDADVGSIAANVIEIVSGGII